LTNTATARWIFDEFGINVRSLAVSRILFGLALLVIMFPRYPWMANFPSSSFAPPLGLAAMFESQPPAWVLWILVGEATILTLLLMFGWRTRVVGLTLAAVLLVCNSFDYAFGKINHDILLIITLVTMSFSDWGEALSLDSKRRPPDHECLINPVRWPLALLVVITGLCMTGAAFAKIRGGWLHLESSATLGHLIANYYVQHRDAIVGQLALNYIPTWMWEGADWSTVLIEAAFLPCAFSLRATRWAYLFAVLFHAGVQYTMHIFFWPNLVTYALVVEWDGLLSPRVTDRLERFVKSTNVWQLCAAGIGLTVAMYFVGNIPQALLRSFGWGEIELNSILMTAVLLGCGYYGMKSMAQALRPSSTPPLLLFDGVCGLCNTSVDWVMRHDPQRQFRFAPLQSPAGQAALRESGLDADYIDSIVLIRGGQVYTHSTAALHVARLLGWPWKALFAFVLIPPILRDLVYDFVAEHRYQWFGKREACRIPTPEERQQLIFELEAA